MDFADIRQWGADHAQVEVETQAIAHALGIQEQVRIVYTPEAPPTGSLGGSRWPLSVCGLAERKLGTEDGLRRIWAYRTHPLEAEAIEYGHARRDQHRAH